MKKVIIILAVLYLFCFSVFAQEQPLDLSKPLPTTEKTEITDDDILEIDGFNFLPEPEKITGKVVGVHDGDTLTLLDEKKVQYKVRFNGIDAPELKQDFGNKSKESLSDLVFGKTATIFCPKVDKYGRRVCTVFVNGTDINLEQIKAGMAWHYKKYEMEQPETDRKAYSEAEINARGQRIGLWLQPNPTEPGAWRRGENNPNLNGVPKGAIIGNTNSQIYHTPGCSSYARVSPQNRIIFASEKEAIAKGYRISGQCESTLQVEERPKPTAPTERKYQKGSRGGCYYLSSSGKKVYVDKQLCS